MSAEQRAVARKILRTKAVVVMDGMPPRQARTIDISVGGLAINFDQQLAVGQAGLVSLELFVEGKGQIITVRGKVAYCIFSGDFFKIGYQFLNVDGNTMGTIVQFLR